MQYANAVAQLPSDEVLADIDSKVDVQKLEDVLMTEGLAKFAKPQKELIALIAEKRAAV